MLTVTDNAIINFKSYLAQNNISSALRIAIMDGGCSGPMLGLALDEKKENDDVITVDALDFLIDKALIAKTGAIKVDFLDHSENTGFSITSENSIGGGGCASGSCSSCG